MIYVFDTNSIRVIGNYYPDQFPTFWKHLDGAVSQGTVISVKEVRKELEFQASDWLKTWIKNNNNMFASPNQLESQYVAEIFAIPHFRALVGEKQILKGQPVADPFLVAAARARGAVVVTEEALKPNAAKIPNVCIHFNVKCTNLQGFMKDMGWCF